MVTQFTDAERLRKARVHPVNVLVAARTYASGGSARGQSSVGAGRPQVIDALDAAFYAATARWSRPASGPCSRWTSPGR